MKACAWQNFLGQGHPDRQAFSNQYFEPMPCRALGKHKRIFKLFAKVVGLVPASAAGACGLYLNLSPLSHRFGGCKS